MNLAKDIKANLISQLKKLPISCKNLVVFISPVSARDSGAIWLLPRWKQCKLKTLYPKKAAKFHRKNLNSENMRHPNFTWNSTQPSNKSPARSPVMALATLHLLIEGDSTSCPQTRMKAIASAFKPWILLRDIHCLPLIHIRGEWCPTHQWCGPGHKTQVGAQSGFYHNPGFLTPCLAKILIMKPPMRSTSTSME